MYIGHKGETDFENPGHPGERRTASCRHCIIWRVGACGAMSGAVALSALEAARLPLRVLEAGDMIYHQGDPPDTVYGVTSGWVAQRQDRSDGRRGVTRFVLPGEAFGLEPDGAAMGHSTVAITPAAICAIPKARHDQLRRQFPEFNERFIWLLEREIHLMLDDASSIFEGSAVTRLSHLLWSLAVRRLGRRPHRDGETIWLPLTQLHLADATGLTPVHVSRTLGRMRDEGLVDFYNRRLTIRDTAALEAIAGADDGLAALSAVLDSARL